MSLFSGLMGPLKQEILLKKAHICRAQIRHTIRKTAIMKKQQKNHS